MCPCVLYHLSHLQGSWVYQGETRPLALSCGYLLDVRTQGHLLRTHAHTHTSKTCGADMRTCTASPCPSVSVSVSLSVRAVRVRVHGHSVSACMHRGMEVCMVLCHGACCMSCLTHQYCLTRCDEAYALLASDTEALYATPVTHTHIHTHALFVSSHTHTHIYRRAPVWSTDAAYGDVSQVHVCVCVCVTCVCMCHICVCHTSHQLNVKSSCSLAAPTFHHIGSPSSTPDRLSA